jgi:hypothetical protein
MTPWTRSFFVRARVSMPQIPGTVLPEPVVEGFHRRFVGRTGAELRNDIAGDLRPFRLEAGGIDAIVADERVGLAQDLAMIGGVGDTLRVADDPGIENDFPPDLGARAEAYALEDGPVR